MGEEWQDCRLGLQVFQVWKEKVEEAVRQEQTLKVVFSWPSGRASAWKDLATVPDLWDGIGCGVPRSAKWPIWT